MRAGHVVLADLVGVRCVLPRANRLEDVVVTSLRGHVQPVRVQVGRVELAEGVVHALGRDALSWQLVAERDLNRLSRPGAYGRSRDLPVVPASGRLSRDYSEVDETHREGEGAARRPHLLNGRDYSQRLGSRQGHQPREDGHKMHVTDDGHKKKQV